MQIVFFSNYFNHHQLHLVDAFNAIDDVDFIFVADHTVPEFRKELGYSSFDRPYLKVLDNSQKKEDALVLSKEADVAIFINSSMESYLEARLKTNKLTFLYSERWFKKKYMLNLLSPRLWRQIFTFYKFRNNIQYMLCASAYAANDYYFFCMYKNKCYKWAYFTEVNDIDINNILQEKRHKRMKLMWCSRFIDWKHPELAVKVAAMLIKQGYTFDLNMYGNGPLLNKTREYIEKQGLSDYVHLKGSRKNVEIIDAMREHHIFLMTSDQNEGWGAVANEAMSNGCAIIGSSKAGSIPFLVNNGKNGLVFQSNNVQSLYLQLKKLLDNPELCEEYAKQAYHDMKSVWSPNVAAHRFLSLVQQLSNGGDTIYSDGPCSKAEPIYSNSVWK